LIKRQERNCFDVIKSEFEHPAVIFWRAIEARYLEDTINKYNPQEPILDLGCAEGKIASALFKDKHLFGLDNCWDLIKENKQTDTYKSLVLADGCKMPFKNNSFGCIFSNCVIEHIPELNSLLNEAQRVLKLKGLFIFTVPSERFGEFLFFHRLFKALRLTLFANWYSKKRNEKLNHFHCYGNAAWKEKLKEKNLFMLEHIYYMPKKAVMLWDWLAISVFLVNKIKPLGFIKRYITRRLKSSLDKFYSQNLDSGGALLIVAAKN